MKYVSIVAVLIILGLLGYLGFKNYSTPQDYTDQTAQDKNFIISDWGTYNNPKLGLEIVYPAGFVARESKYGYPDRISFESNLVKLGHFDITVFNLTESKIGTLDDIPRMTKEASDRRVLSSRDVTNNNGVTARIVEGVQYTFENGKPNPKKFGETVSVLFIHNPSAYQLEWSCWSQQICLDDQAIEKVVASIKFNK